MRKSILSLAALLFSLLCFAGEAQEKYKAISIKDLKEGDILCFEVDKTTLLSRAISYLTDSKITHAGIALGGDQEINENWPCVKIESITDDFLKKGRGVYVKRIDKQPVKTGKKVVKIANTYLNPKTPYGTPDIILFGVLLVTKKFTPTTPVQKRVLKIMEKICADLAKFIDKEIDKNKRIATCSQFVYNCYEEAGQQIIIVDPIIKGENKPSSCLLNMINESNGFQAKLGTNDIKNLMAAGTNANESYEELAKSFLMEVKIADQKYSAGNNNEKLTIDPELAKYINIFGILLSSSSKADMNKKLQEKPTSGISYLKSLDFVAPADLFNKCKNTSPVGVIKATSKGKSGKI